MCKPTLVFILVSWTKFVNQSLSYLLLSSLTLIYRDMMLWWCGFNLSLLQYIIPLSLYSLWFTWWANRWTNWPFGMHLFLIWYTYLLDSSVCCLVLCFMDYMFFLNSYKLFMKIQPFQDIFNQTMKDVIRCPWGSATVLSSD